MNAKKMLARYAQGGMVDESVDVSRARQMLQNLSSPVQHFANGSEVVPAGFRRSLITGELVPIAATVEQLTDIYRGGEAKQANADAAARAIAAAETPVQAGPAVSPPPSNLSEGLQYATGEGGIGADQYYANIRKFINTQGADLNAAEIRAEMDKYGVSDKDVRDALAGTQYSAGAVHALLNPDIGAKGSPGYGVGGLEGMSANIRARLEEAAAQAQTGALTKTQAEDFFKTHLSPTGGFNEQDLMRATGKTSAQLLAEMKFKPAGAPVDPRLLPPTEPLPDLPGEFVAPTAPLPEAPPAALTTGQEGLDPGTEIVKAIPEEERVTIPQLDTEFRASAPRTAIYDRFGRITGYNYSPAAKLTPATGTNVFNFVPPGITSRPRSLLNIGDVPGVTIDPVTGQMTMPLSASQRFARDRAELDNQFRRLYARAAEADTSLPTQAPATAAAAFRNFAMNDPTMSAQLRMRNIEQTPTVNPTAAMTAARSEFGAAPYAAALTQAFDPFLARNRASLLASKDMQRSYFERYPDLVAEYEKNWSKTMSPEEYAAYHYRTLGQKEGRTPPNLMGSPYTQQFFSEGGEASTEDFIKKQSGGDVSRETASPTNPLDYTPGLSDKGLGAGFADPGVVEMIDRFDRNQLRSTPELTALDQLIALQGSNVLNQGLANTMSVDQITGDIDPVQSLRNLQAYDPASFEATLRTLQDVPSLVPQSGLGSLRLGMEQLQGLEGVTPTQVGETANAFATMLKQPETGSQVQDIAQNIRSIIENQPLARFQTNVGFTPEGNVDPYAAFRRTGGISYKEPSALEDPLVPPIPPGFQEGGEVTTEEFIKKNVSRGTSEVPQLTPEGRLIDENAEMRSESQRMLNRLKTAQQESYRRGKLPPGIQRAVTDVASEEKPPLVRGKAIQTAGDIVGGLVSATPREPTNPSEAYRLMQGFTGAYLPTAPVVRTAQAAKMAAQEPRATMSAARQSLEALGDIPVALAQPNQLGSQAGAIRLGGKESGNKPSSIFTPLPKADAPFVGRLDTFVAELPGAVRKDQFLGSLEGKFRSYEIGRAQEALRDLPGDAKLSPVDLLNRIKQRYDPAYYRTQVVEPQPSSFYYQMDNVYQGPAGDEFPLGVIHLIQADNPQNVSKGFGKKLEKMIDRTFGGSLSPEQLTETRSDLLNIFGTLSSADKRRLAGSWTPYARANQEAEGFEQTVHNLLYPSLNRDFTETLYKSSLSSPETRDAALTQILQDTAEVAKNKYGIEGLEPHLPGLIQEHLGNQSGTEAYNAVRGLVSNRRRELSKKVYDSAKGFRSTLRDLEDKQVENYRGQHTTLGNENNPIAFSRFSEHTTDIPGLGTTKGIYVNELQSDRLDDIRTKGPYGGSAQKDLATRVIPLKEQQAQLLEQFIKLKSKGASYDQLSAASKQLNALDEKIAKATKRVMEGTYSIRESFPGMEESPQVIQQLMAKNVISAAINRGVNFVAFPGAESKQAQLYEKLPNNLKQVVKDLGPGFEFRPVTLRTPDGQELTHPAVVWGPEAANRIKQKGVPFKDGGEVNVPRETSTSKQQLDKLAQVSQRKKA